MSAPVIAPERRGLVMRIAPPGLYAGRSQVLMERSSLVYRRGWLTILSGFFEPLFYLLSFGVGLGTLVGNVVGPDGQPITYAAFIAPALLASSAMNGAVYDSTINVFFKMKFAKLYEGMLATPLGPLDIALGEIGWALTRGLMYAVGFVLVMLVMGLLTSWWALLLIPAALLIAFGFAAIGMGITTYMSSWQHLDLVTLAVLPMFLFSGTFFSLDAYPEPIRIIVQCLPLHHGVELLRGLTIGVLDPMMIGHVGYFLAMVVVGVVISARRLGKLLLT